MYDEQCQPMGMVGPAINARPTLTDTLEDRKASLEKQLKEVTDALDALKKNPELQNLLDLVQKARY